MLLESDPYFGSGAWPGLSFPDLSKISLSDFTGRLMRTAAMYAPELFKFVQTPGTGLMTIGRLGLFNETAISREVQFASKL